MSIKAVLTTVYNLLDAASLTVFHEDQLPNGITSLDPIPADFIVIRLITDTNLTTFDIGEGAGNVRVQIDAFSRALGGQYDLLETASDTLTTAGWERITTTPLRTPPGMYGAAMDFRRLAH